MATSTSTTTTTNDLSRSIYEDIKRPDEVLKLAMTDTDKFTIIVNLLEVGRVTNVKTGEIVNTVLHLVSFFYFIT